MSIYAISHIIQIWILPLGFSLLLGFTGLFLSRHWHVLGKLLITIAFVNLFFLSTPLVAQKLIDGLQYKYPAFPIAQFTKPKSSAVIVVLGGRVNIVAPEYETPAATVSDAAMARLAYAAYLYHKTHLSIIVSGGDIPNHSYSEADIMQKNLHDIFQIPVYLKENKSTNTAEQSKLLVPLLKHKKINIIYLVTNAWHMPRSFNAFKNSGLTIIPAPTGYVSLIVEQSIMNYLPSMDALNISNIALHEYIGILWYRLYYGIKFQK